MCGLKRYAAVAAILPAIMYGENIIVPVEGGNIVVKDARFIRQDGDGHYLPELSFKIENHTAVAWWTVELEFLIIGRCNGEQRHWSISAKTSLGWSEDHIVGNVYKETDDSLEGKADGCHTETINAILKVAQNGNRRLVGPKQAKKEAGEAERQKRLRAERKQREDEERAKDAENRKKVRAACAAIYESTANKKIADLTVKEEQQVRSCQGLGLYPPQ